MSVAVQISGCPAVLAIIEGVVPLPVVRNGLTWNIYAKLSVPDPAPSIFVPYSPQLLTVPLALPQVQIYNPSGTAILGPVNMVQVLDANSNPIVGLYVYEWAVPSSPLGTYSCLVNCKDPSNNASGSADQTAQTETTPFVQVV